MTTKRTSKVSAEDGNIDLLTHFPLGHKMTLHQQTLIEQLARERDTALQAAVEAAQRIVSLTNQRDEAEQRLADAKDAWQTERTERSAEEIELRRQLSIEILAHDLADEQRDKALRELIEARAAIDEADRKSEKFEATQRIDPGYAEEAPYYLRGVR